MPETPPNPLRYVHAGRVGDVAKRVREPDFIDHCVQVYRSAGFGEPGESEVRSWRNSWPALLGTLVRAELQDLWIYLEFATPGADSRFDALIVGQRAENKLVTVVVELKQWTEAPLVAKNLVLPSWSEKPIAHPLAQVGAYMAFLHGWFASETVDLDVRGVVYLHNASRSQTEVVDRTGSLSPEHRVPVVGRDHVAEAGSAEELRGLLRCADIRELDERHHVSFVGASWRANDSLLSKLAQVLRREPSFRLIGDQQSAMFGIRSVVQGTLASGHRSIIVVRGGPGSGKTVLAMRLLAEYIDNPQVRARYGTPSGSLTRNLRETIGVDGSNPLFKLPENLVSDCGLLIIDEIHRFRRYQGGFRSYVLGNLSKVPVVVVFLDERQRVRPSEGVTEREIREIAEQAPSPINVVGYSLEGSFRCNGSREFNVWVDDMLYDRPKPWNGSDYDLAVSPDPSEMDRWLEERLEQEHSARISAGFCWGYEEAKPGEELPGVTIEWHGEPHGVPQRWQRPWNLHTTNTVDIEGRLIGPPRWLWATRPGGEHQVGCVYTAQGLEYDHAGIIFGPDLVRRGDRWIAEPRHSHDPAMRSVNAHEYLPLAKNTYRVLMTRGMRSCRLYSTDEETQEFLTSLVPSTTR
ncbi:DNA/RNA helicase domain-containing protein [Nocardiopsis alba]|uniref:DNA/RNA helicase domain-containing protein n=1 Tax=Nocardiopsis alba TaxID=53437 RepID=UPI0035DA9686